MGNIFVFECLYVYACGTSGMNAWCHKCLHHNMHTLPEQEKKDLGRGWRVRTMETGQPTRLN